MPSIDPHEFARNVLREEMTHNEDTVRAAIKGIITTLFLLGYHEEMIYDVKRECYNYFSDFLTGMQSQ